MAKKETTASLIRKYGYVTLKIDGPKDIPKPEGGFFKFNERVPRNLHSEAVKKQIARLRRFAGRRR